MRRIKARVQGLADIFVVKRVVRFVSLRRVMRDSERLQNSRSAEIRRLKLNWRGRMLIFLSVLLILPTAAAAAKPNIILITLDTVRADRVGFLGSTRGLTPTLDALAQHGVIFSRAYSQAPLTTASHATILTGTFPQFHGVNEFGEPLRDDLPFLPALLKQQGYRTAAFVGSLVLDPAAGLAPGFDRGFDFYDAGFRKPLLGEDRFQTLERRGAKVIDHAKVWLSKRPEGPLFLWIHLYDAHDPYDPPKLYAERFAHSPYDGEIAYLDSCMSKLLWALRTEKLLDDSVIALMSDHGEALGQHSEETHGIFLYDETIHIPLLLKLPNNRYRQTHVASRVGLVDVAPTLLDIAGIPIPDTMQGHSLLSLVQKNSTAATRNTQNSESAGTDRAAAPIYSESEYSSRAFGWSSLRSLRMGKYLFVEAPRSELYDESVDPLEQHNLAQVNPAVRDTLQAKLNEVRRDSIGASEPRNGANLDKAQVERLNALGYVAARSTQEEATAPINRTDPKDKIDVANCMHEGLMQIEEGRYGEAVPKLERVLAEQPDIVAARLQLGIAFSRLGQYDKALPLLRQSTQESPDLAGSAHYELGVALFASGDIPGSVPDFEFAVARSPQSSDAHYSLGSAYAQTDRAADAIKELLTALHLTPQHYMANLLLGRIFSLQGDAQTSLPYLKKASQIRPDAVDAHLFLADTYEQLNRPNEAQAERQAANLKKLSTQPAH